MLVAGAGPAGSAVATLLARAGHRVRLVDRAAFPRDKACSEYMSPEAVRILDRLGVVADLEAAGAVPNRGTVVTAARGARLEGRFDRAGYRPFRATGLSVARRLLDHRLALAAQGAG
ncbi:MAG TPA: FAD-dependent monooxygenase, partial [Thermoanaerobaculia bacterium]